MKSLAVSHWKKAEACNKYLWKNQRRVSQSMSFRMTQKNIMQLMYFLIYIHLLPFMTEFVTWWTDHYYDTPGQSHVSFPKLYPHHQLSSTSRAISSVLSFTPPYCFLFNTWCYWSYEKTPQSISVIALITSKTFYFPPQKKQEKDQDTRDRNSRPR